METLYLHYQGDLYRVVYDPDVLVALEVIWYVTPNEPVEMDYDELEPELQTMIEKGMTA